MEKEGVLSLGDYFSKVNAPALYLVVGVVLLAVAAMCVVFFIKSWRAGVRLGMDKAVLKKAVVSSATFSVLPSVSILLGVIALAGTLGIPLPWLRLSVIGNLQYELNVAEISAQSIGMEGLAASAMTPKAYTTIALVMTCAILWGALLCIFTLPAYSRKLSKPKTLEDNGEKKASFGNWAMVAMFVGMCATYVGSYVGGAAHGNWLPLFTALAAAAGMAVCEFLERKKNLRVLESFDLAASMLLAMAAAVVAAGLV